MQLKFLVLTLVVVQTTLPMLHAQWPTSAPESSISLDLVEADLKNVLRIIDEKANTSHVMIDPVRGRISYRTRNTPWRTALQEILALREAQAVVDGNVIKVYKSESLKNKPQPPIKKYQGRLISLDLQDTEIDNALRIVEEVAGLAFPDKQSQHVKGRVTLRLIDVPWDQVLDILVEPYGFTGEIWPDKISLRRFRPTSNGDA